MYDNDPINGYYNLLVAVIVRAVDDFLQNKEQMTEYELRKCLRNFFSDESKIDAIVTRAKDLIEAGYKSVSEGRFYEKEK